MSVRELFELGGKVAVVTGGSRGLGLQIALALGRNGGKNRHLRPPERGIGAGR